MGIANWMRVLDTVSGLARMGGKLRSLTLESGPATQSGGGTLETRLAGVVVAALKEAFDRDRARMDLERAQIDAERRRVEEALAAELRRQTAERALGQLRLRVCGIAPSISLDRRVRKRHTARERPGRRGTVASAACAREYGRESAGGVVKSSIGNRQPSIQDSAIDNRKIRNRQSAISNQDDYRIRRRLV
jgi:hypothetical protein